MAARLTLFFSLLSVSLFAQFASPISWTFEQRHLEGDEFELIATARADAGWSLYSQFTDEGGPVPTTFYWDEGAHYERIGQTTETGHRKEGMDELFGVNVIKFLSDEPAVFTQTVRVLDYGQPITGEVEFMCCDDTQCLPPTTEPFTFSVEAPAAAQGGAGAQETTIPESSTASETPLTPPAPAEAAADPTVNMPAEEVMASHRVSLPPPTEETPVSWDFLVEEMGGDRYRLSLTGTMAETWTVYSKDVDPTIGPIPTEWAITGTGGVEPIGAVTETADHLKKKYDTTWEAEVAKIDGGTVTYSQTVRAPNGQVIEGDLTYQTCNDEMCLPPRDLPFRFDPTTGTANLDGITNGESDGDPATVAAATPNITDYAINAEPVASCNIGEAATRGQSLWTIFGLGLLGGLFALIMPCIFPMIPLTVSFFTKSGGSRAEGVKGAALYGFFIFLIYVLLSVPFHLIAGIDPGILNNIASNIWLNIVFFVVFVVFAGSFFGFYELTLPQSWSNRASQAEGVGGTVGIFFMALTLALVSFSCTGPILGSLLVEAVSDGAWPLTAGMAGFGVALGLPFALFAAFPGVLNNMPKSGGWLNSVKVVLGFVELALAFKFLSNADLVGDWNLLRIEPFLIIWMLCALGIAAYLLRLISFPHDSSKRKIGPVAGLVAAASVLFAVYLAFGFTKNEDSGSYESLNLLSGIAPPVCYSYLNPCDCPQGITCFKDLDAGLAYAKEVNKPVMLDFTGYTCVNCRKMEENVWSQDRINDLLTEDYVLISLYVDDRKELPAEQQREVTRLDGSGRNFLIDQVGEKWHYFQQSVFQHATQPYYVLVSPDGQTLNPPVAYTPDEEKYEAFLRCGLEAFQGLK
ncbi:thiol:disulfide interchange protein DsbD [Neolewinella xylanilytica]|uniref:Thiol:disulfide interchange protein DsbD n=1 Tax=Neolewinella xylanilytica TaxID=1514080 RepID=A0A2S6I7L7_9BACT|nr:cytochrome c biogenesis protein CcdA [Neolewinella xylanilytica]PPK87491.1 thiol:disulfide interchange protein DsbD [Neolewinella xylanilytica]